MKTSAPPPRLQDDSAENLFNQAPSLKVPMMWLGLILLPIVLGVIGTAIYGKDEVAFAPPLPAPNPVVSAEKISPSEMAILRGRGRRAVRQRPGTEQINVCPFKIYVGKTVDESVINAFRALERPVIFEKESGQRAPTADKKRINIYVDPYRVITRIVCG